MSVAVVAVGAVNVDGLVVLVLSVVAVGSSAFVPVVVVVTFVVEVLAPAVAFVVVGEFVGCVGERGPGVVCSAVDVVVGNVVQLLLPVVAFGVWLSRGCEYLAGLVEVL